MKSGFGKPGKDGMPPPGPRPKPHKRPTQARATFTVEAIYQAFVRIWLRDGWQRLTTREVALEAGFAVGTLYDYFPSKEALLSGYIRHCIDLLLLRLDSEVVHAEGLDWRARVQRLVRLCGAPEPATQLFDLSMAMLEHEIAEPKHHQRVYQELSAKWRQALAACVDLPQPIAPQTADALFIMLWGGRRYCLTAQLCAEQVDTWLAEAERTIYARLEAAP